MPSKQVGPTQYTLLGVLDQNNTRRNLEVPVQKQSSCPSFGQDECQVHFPNSSRKAKYSLLCGFLFYKDLHHNPPAIRLNPPATRDTWVRSLGWEDPLAKGKATHSSILAWRIP